jgi:hypothetical protein
MTAGLTAALEKKFLFLKLVIYPLELTATTSQSVWRLGTGWTVRGSNCSEG